MIDCTNKRGCLLFELDYWESRIKDGTYVAEKYMKKGDLAAAKACMSIVNSYESEKRMIVRELEELDNNNGTES